MAGRLQRQRACEDHAIADWSERGSRRPRRARPLTQQPQVKLDASTLSNPKVARLEKAF